MPGLATGSIPAVLRERASLQPNEPAFTFIDYDHNPDGVAETLTWSQLYLRTRHMAAELRRHGTVGDRAAIVAPQGLDYIVGLLGAFEAGLIAVPLSVPHLGAHDERINRVLADSAPAVVLTTSAVAGGVAEYLTQQDLESTWPFVEVDALDVDDSLGFTGRGPDNGTALLQYTSGSTRQPAGVMVSHRNLVANFEQVMNGYFGDTGGVAPSPTTIVSWLPFYHDMGLFIGVFAPILAGLHSVLTSPMSFLVRPARWVQLMATNPGTFTPAPNFAFELAVRKTSDDDMAGLDLQGVTHIICGAERVHSATLTRFTERFAQFNLRPQAIRPSYGLAEATVYVAARAPGHPPKVVHFESDKLSAGHAEPRSDTTGTALVSYGVPLAPTVRIVDPESRTEKRAGAVGEIWVHGDNVAQGYWGRPDATAETFTGVLVEPSAGTPDGPWLRTGDLGVISDGELFIVGRIKDLIIINGRNQYPDDLEATVQELTGGRVAAISVPDAVDEQVALVIEYKPRGGSEEEIASRIDVVKRDVNYAISSSHGIRVADLVLVAPGSIPITTSGKIRRIACAELYRENQLTRIS
ncbi:MAG TPA: AMP-binding protein [Mycobacterium sp.]|uniref:AMP-binding protein n=1 Tax=Mycobacterium sp. TaxID=1785 RepID=UPI002F3F4713